MSQTEFIPVSTQAIAELRQIREYLGNIRNGSPTFINMLLLPWRWPLSDVQVKRCGLPTPNTCPKLTRPNFVIVWFVEERSVSRCFYFSVVCILVVWMILSGYVVLGQGGVSLAQWLDVWPLKH